MRHAEGWWGRKGVGVSRDLLRGPQGPGLGRLFRRTPWWLFWNTPHLVDPTSPMKELGQCFDVLDREPSVLC